MANPLHVMVQQLGRLALLLACPIAAAQLPPVEAFFQSAKLLDAKLSPDGSHIAVTTAASDGSAIGLFVVDTRQSPPQSQQVAGFANSHITDFEWVGDKHLVFSFPGHAGLGGGLFSVHRDGSQLRQLIARLGREHAVKLQTRAMLLPANHLLLHVPRGNEAHATEVILGEAEFKGEEVRAIKPLWQDVRNGRTRPYEMPAPPAGVMRWWFNDAGEVKAAVAINEGQEALYWLGQEGDSRRWQMLAQAPLTQLPFEPQWVGSGDQLYVWHRHGERGERVVSAFDFARNAPGTQVLVKAPGFDFRGQLLSEGNRLQGVRVNAETLQTIWFDPARKGVQQQIDAELPGRVNLIDCRRCDTDDALALVKSYSDQHPGEYLVFRRNQRPSWQRIGVVLPAIDPARMAQVELQRFHARDGLEIPVWLTVPAGEAKPRPTVILVHGGPWIRGGSWRWKGLQQFLASRGYLVLEPEFRGSDGYGEKHLRAGFKQWGQAMQDDIADTLRWAQAKGLASEDACIAGASYGGYSTLMGLIRHPELYRCGIAWVALTDPLLYLQGAWWIEDDVSGLARRHLLPEMVGDVERDRDMLRRNSPVLQAASIRAPVLLAFGEEDLRIPLRHGKRMLSALRKAGQEPEWLSYPHEGHVWTRTATHVDFARRVEAFLGKHLPKR